MSEHALGLPQLKLWSRPWVLYVHDSRNKLFCCRIFTSLKERELRWLKVLTNEKRGGLTVVSFDGPPFKLFSLRFSYKSMQATSCKRTNTNQRTLFLSFAIKNCFPRSDEKLLAIFELILGDFSPL